MLPHTTATRPDKPTPGFAAGTLIQFQNGARRVETLRAGDLMGLDGIVRSTVHPHWVSEASFSTGIAWCWPKACGPKACNRSATDAPMIAARYSFSAHEAKVLRCY